jgi:hypothetical protein
VQENQSVIPNYAGGYDKEDCSSRQGWEKEKFLRPPSQAKKVGHGGDTLSSQLWQKAYRRTAVQAGMGKKPELSPKSSEQKRLEEWLK